VTALDGFHTSPPSWDGGGGLSWTYDISPELRTELTRVCPTRQNDSSERGCVVERRYDQEREATLIAEISDHSLTLSVNFDAN
jgi:hypothetical protein